MGDPGGTSSSGLFPTHYCVCYICTRTKKFQEHNWQQVWPFPCYLLEGLLSQSHYTHLWTFAPPFFIEWADWKDTLFCPPARRFLERHAEGLSTTNLTSVQPKLDSCRLHYTFWEESEGRKTLAAWKWQSTESHQEIPTVEMALTVYLAAHVSG